MIPCAPYPVCAIIDEKEYLLADTREDILCPSCKFKNDNVPLSFRTGEEVEHFAEQQKWRVLANLAERYFNIVDTESN